MGEQAPYELQEHDAARRLGFAIERHYGCVLTEPIIRGTGQYNFIMERFVERYIDKDWRRGIGSMAQEMYIKDSLVFSSFPVESLVAARLDIPLLQSLSI